MRNIFKYTVPVDAQHTDLDLPYGATFLPHLEMVPQGSHLIWLWAIVNPINVHSPVRMVVRGTGHPIGDGEVYVGSVRDGNFVWHVFKQPVP